jgi:hypothetical protein
MGSKVAISTVKDSYLHVKIFIMIIPNMSGQNQDRRFYKFYKIKPKCSFAEIIDLLLKPRSSQGVGRGMECEIHIDGDFLFMAFGALGAALAFLTYQAITMAGRKRRKRKAELKQNENFLLAELEDFVHLGIYLFFLF